MQRIKSISSINWGFPFSGPNEKEPSKAIYQIDLNHEIGPGILFHDSLVSIAHAHRKHDKGNQYVCYGTWVGPGLVWLMYPMQNEDCVGDLLSDDKALLETADKENNNPTKPLEDLKSTMINEKRRVLKYKADFSNISNEVEKSPYDYIYYMAIKLKDSARENDFGFYINKLINANNNVDVGYNWITYIDENNDSYEAHVFIPMRTFSKMDKWIDVKDILNVYTKDDEINIRGKLYSYIESIQTHLMTFVPSCDNSGFEFNE